MIHDSQDDDLFLQMFVLAALTIVLVLPFPARGEKGDQKLTCKDGQALSAIEWSQLDEGYQNFSIDCATINEGGGSSEVRQPCRVAFTTRLTGGVVVSGL